jgi:tetratricopeptide (TPR) repeat protein
VLANLGRLDESLFQLKAVLTRNPRSNVALNDIGAILASRGQVKEAAEYFTRALQSNQYDPFGHDGLGWTLVAEGKREEGIQHFREALRLRPGMDTAALHLKAALAGESFANTPIK